MTENSARQEWKGAGCQRCGSTDIDQKHWPGSATWAFAAIGVGLIAFAVFFDYARFGVATMDDRHSFSVSSGAINGVAAWAGIVALAIAPTQIGRIATCTRCGWTWRA